MTHTANYCPALSGQHGVTLLTGLVLLAAISLLALVATSSMVLQLRMADNFEDSRLALQNSAMAVTLGEDFLYSLGQDGRIPDCQARCFNSPLSTIIHEPTDLPAFPENEAESWWRSVGAIAGVAPLSDVPIGSSGVPDAEPPRFLIEEVHFDPTTGAPVNADAPLLDGIGYYRILGRGSGRDATTIAVSESIIARPWKADSLPGPGNGDVTAFCADYRPWYDCGRMAWRQRR
jgi:Tfp pilus assembly protein PilX